MTTDAGEQLPALPQVEEFEFYDDQLIAVIIDGVEVAVPIAVVCKAMQMNTRNQTNRLREHAVLSQGLRMVKIPLSGRVQTVLAISRKYLAFWLATITPSLVGDQARPKLIRYQTELVDVLDTLYGGAETAPLAPSAPYQAQLDLLRVRLEQLSSAFQSTQDQVDTHEVRLGQVEHLVGDKLTTVQGQLDETQQRLLDTVKITAAQQGVIRRAIERMGKRYELKHGKEIYDRLYAQFRTDMGIPRYDALPAAKYAEALDWLRAAAARWLPGDEDALPPLQESLL